MIGFSIRKGYAWQDGRMKVHGYVEKSYVLYPSVLRTMKTISIRQSADNSIRVTEDSYAFPLGLMVYLACIVLTWFLWFRRPKSSGG